MRDARKPFGKLDVAHARSSSRARTELPGAPDGDYAIIEFDTKFANGKQATEQVIWTLEADDVWRVAGYFIPLTQTRMLSAEALQKIDREIAKYPPDQKQSAVMSALAIAQDEQGWLVDRDDGFRRALPRHAAGRGVRGRDVLHDVQPASRPAATRSRSARTCRARCRTRSTAAEHLKQRLGIGFGETTADGQFTLKEGECMGACGDAPVLLVNNKRMCSFMRREKLDALLAELGACRKRERRRR